MGQNRLLFEPFDAVMSKAGFRRQADSWHRRIDHVVQILNLQKGPGSNCYYVNLAWWFSSEAMEPPRFYQAHIIGRWDSVVPEESRYLEQLLDFEEEPETMSVRAARAASLVEEHVIQFFNSTSTVDQLRAAYRENRLRGFGLTGVALTQLGLTGSSAARAPS